MTCRGGQGSGFTPSPDADWVLVYRLDGNEAAGTPQSLAPGTCAWSAAPRSTPVLPRIVFPYAGPLVTEAYPIGPQARTCAGDARCVMTFCALDTGRELRAVDGFIRLSFW